MIQPAGPGLIGAKMILSGTAAMSQMCVPEQRAGALPDRGKHFYSFSFHSRLKISSCAQFCELFYMVKRERHREVGGEHFKQGQGKRTYLFVFLKARDKSVCLPASVLHYEVSKALDENKNF